MTRSVGWLVIWCAAVLLAPLLSPRDPLAIDSPSLLSPSAQHWLGTDSLGRDVLSRTLHGGRLTIAAGMIATAIGAGLGTTLGLTATLATPLLRRTAVISATALASLPGLVVALVAITLLGPGFGQIAVAVGIAQAPAMALFTSEISRSVLAEPYILSARSAGAGAWGIAIRHVWPNIQRTWMGYTIIIFAQCIMSATALGFLGLNGDLSAPEWGSMLAEARQVVRAAPWLGIPAGVGIAITVLLANRASFTRQP